MKSSIIDKLIAQLILQCQGKGVECMVSTIDADLTENVASNLRSPDMQRNIESVAAERWIPVLGTDKIAFSQDFGIKRG
jgi:hypothetical protein